jgi:hypothetical protein
LFSSRTYYSSIIDEELENDRFVILDFLG